MEVLQNFWKLLYDFAYSNFIYRLPFWLSLLFEGGGGKPCFFFKLRG